MFYDKLIQLCNQKGVSVTKMCQDIGLSNATATKWKKGKAPRYSTLFKIAEYFNVEVEYFLADNYTSYVEWLAEKKHMSVAQVINPKWMEEEVRPVEPDPYEVLLPLLKQLTPTHSPKSCDTLTCT